MKIVISSILFFCNALSLYSQSPVFIDRSELDTSVSPKDDFYAYVNNYWEKHTKVPDGYSLWGGFITAYDENFKKLNALLLSLPNEPHVKNSLEQKASDFYKSAINIDVINKASYKPLLAELRKIESAKNYQELLDIIAQWYPTGDGYLFRQLFRQGDGNILGFTVGPDEKNREKNVAIFEPAGLTVSFKQYYIDSNATEVRRAILEMAKTYFKIIGHGETKSSKKAKAALHLEVKIALLHKTREELREVSPSHTFSLSEAEKIAPNIGWKRILKILKINCDSINLPQPEYFKGLSTLLTQEPLEAWKAKVTLDYINSKAAYLSNNFISARYKLSKSIWNWGFDTTFNRPETMAALTDMQLPDVVGPLYVRRYFDPRGKVRMDSLVNNIQKAFAARIQKLNWMSDSTKQKALFKLSKITKNICYPDTWRNYDDVNITADNFLANMQSIGKHNYFDMISNIGKPNKIVWDLTMVDVDGNYTPSTNTIQATVGIMVPPYFHINAEDAYNYAGIGKLIAHEMTHAFDDRGRQFDAFGNVRNWWQPADEQKFRDKSQRLIDQIEGYIIDDSLHVNGRLTLGENISDLGGLAIAYDAFKLTNQGKSSDLIDGLTPDQRFFIFFARVERSISKTDDRRWALSNDFHSPHNIRVNAPLSNFEPFYKAFNVSENYKMYRSEKDRITIW